MPMRQALLLARRSRWNASGYTPHRALQVTRSYAKAHPVDELVDEQLDKPLTSSQSLATEAPAAQPGATSPQTEREERIAKAQIIFGSRLAGPALRKQELDDNSVYIAGVLVPPRPEEPDNCCMSGCVNCVWDRYREEFEDWAAKNAEAQAAKLAQQKASVDTASSEGQTDGMTAMSMDDDGGGSETNWSASDADPFADVPVGIREFMKTEKRLRAKEAAAASAKI